MTLRATVREQPCRGFALIEILRIGRRTSQRTDDTEDKQIAPQPWLRHEFF
jgi:hypothetical protein